MLYALEYSGNPATASALANRKSPSTGLIERRWCARIVHMTSHKINENIFREYDIRGVVDRDLTDESVYDLSRAIGTFFSRNGAGRASIGRDARESSPRFRD